MKITLVAVWLGPLPNYLPKFLQRARAGRLVDVKLVHLTNWTWREEFRHRIAWATGVMPPTRVSGHKIAEYRPAFGEIFREELRSSDWWGWCDVDMIFGAFHLFFTPERLAEYDIITDNPRLLNGCLTILRNDEKMRTLYRRDVGQPAEQQFAQAFANPEQLAFDEYTITEIARLSPDVKTLYLDAHYHDQMDEPPSLPTIFDDGRMTVADREILAYHVTHPERWPVDELF